MKLLTQLRLFGLSERYLFRLFAALLTLAFSASTFSQSENEEQPNTPPLMTLEHMEQVIARLDDNYQHNRGVFAFTYANREITIVTDERADRMRVIIPVVESSTLDEEMMLRLMQANFDSALDARYAIAQGILWSTFLHRLSSLDDRDFLSGIGQTINTADSFGTSFSSGELVFGGGDSSDINRRQLIDQLQSDGNAI